MHKTDTENLYVGGSDFYRYSSGTVISCELATGIIIVRIDDEYEDFKYDNIRLIFNGNPSNFKISESPAKGTKIDFSFFASESTKNEEIYVDSVELSQKQ